MDISVIITCYNYERYVSFAIDSVISQIKNGVELIVVDDCSTDNSREAISSFGDNCKRIFHDRNQGHGAAFNSGFQASVGRLVMFLDADDFLLPNAIDTILALETHGAALYSFRMRLADAQGNLSGLHPPKDLILDSGNVVELLRKKGRYEGSLTSGLVFSREALLKVMPIDEIAFRQGADGYLSSTVPFYGSVFASEEPISGYRQHGMNHSGFNRRLLEKATWRLHHDHQRHSAIRLHAKLNGLSVTPNLENNDTVNLELRLCLSLFGKKTVNDAIEPRRQLARLGLRSAFENRSLRLRSKIAHLIWWSALGYLPSSIARGLFSWKFDATSRPALVNWIARRLRKTLGVAIR